MSELKPCPFCGSEAFIANCFDDSSDVGYYVVCKNDNCQGEGNWEYRGAQGAIESWNTRPLEDALQAKLDIAVEALKLVYPTSESRDIRKYAEDKLTQILNLEAQDV